MESLMNDKENFKEVEIRIPLPGFDFQRKGSLHDELHNPHAFIGRDKEKKRLLNILLQTKKSGGSYLVSGYRGVGKTRFVSEVLAHYKSKIANEKSKDQRILLDVHLSLGSDNNLDARTVFTNMITLLHHKFTEHNNGRIVLFNGLWFILASLPAFFFLSFVYIMKGSFGFDGVSDYFPLSLMVSPPVSYIILLFIMFLPVILFKRFKTKCEFQYRLHSLIRDMRYSREMKAGFKVGSTSVAGKKTSKPLSTNEIECEITSLLDWANNYFDIIFTFDELDKLTGGSATDQHNNERVFASELKERKQKVDKLLGELKNLISSANARFIFISGREMYDAYLSETGSANSLYESLFSEHIYIPSLLTDHSDNNAYLMDSMTEHFICYHLFPEDERKSKYNEYLNDGSSVDFYNTFLSMRNYLQDLQLNSDDQTVWDRTYILKALIHFLTLHSWGNYKRLITLFNTFVRKSDDITSTKFELYFSTRDIQRLVMSSQLYILFHHKISRILTNADDKLVVSSFAILHYILKFHRMAFSRGYVNRMYETLNMNSSPELSRIIDLIIREVLTNHIRRVRNSMYRYRFSSLYEQEIHYITTISDNESAAFNFSLNVMDNVKQYYLTLLKNIPENHSSESKNVEKISLHIIIGNYHAWEQSFDEAQVHYKLASLMLEDRLEKRSWDFDVSDLLQLVETYLKQGNVAEYTRNYSMAAAIYRHAEKVLIKYESAEEINIFGSQDSKWDVLRQPFWASRYLHLKRSSKHYKRIIQEGDIRSLDPELPGKKSLLKKNAATDNPVYMYRNGILASFLDCHTAALKEFKQADKILDDHPDSERLAFLRGNTYLKSAYCYLSMFGDHLHSDLQKNDKKDGRAKFIAGMLAMFKQLNDNSLNSLESFNTQLLSMEIKEFEPEVFPLQAIKLMATAAKSLESHQLYSNAARAYLAIGFVWVLILEMIPWRIFIEGDKYDNISIKELKKNIEAISNRRWIIEAERKALECSNQVTSGAFSHSMKTLISRGMNRNLAKVPLIRALDDPSLEKLDSKYLNNFLFQSYSMFGQLSIAGIMWRKVACAHISDSFNEINIENGARVLPYSCRYYTTVLWLQGKSWVSNTQKKIVKLDKADDEDLNGTVIPNEVKTDALKAIVHLFRSLQYTFQSNAHSSVFTSPPSYLIYYNLWEMIYTLVNRYGKFKNHNANSCPYTNATIMVRTEMDHHLLKHEIQDVSSRVLDLNDITNSTCEQLRAVEMMGDPSSRARSSMLRNKFYLDDDHEDNIFNLDWCFSRSFTAGAKMHILTIEHDMNQLKSKFCENCSKFEQCPQDNHKDSPDRGEPVADA